MGDLELTPCDDLEDSWRGTIEVPQDREDDSSDEARGTGTVTVTVDGRAVEARAHYA
ncbi:MAG: hypothetical protein ABW009_11635 [Acidimicrobiales bacterium]